jgi:CheY-like chemotaxis protein
MSLAPPVPADRTVLIVDDDRQVREVLHEVFLSRGYTCHVAGNGQEGLEVFESVRPPLTVTDMKAREEIRRSAGTQFDPAIVESFLMIPLDILEEIRDRSLR